MLFMNRSRSNNWLYVTSAMLGGLFLGISYNKYGRDIRHKLMKMKDRGMSNITNSFDLD
ncbi:hypothetical protein Sgly_1688 [Syntrophobotulus glycolicus DSM 8271]|uniref:Uncharacterized protein n=1 Tax=Syntrophobotulus glycolicus (strain DSM 8271 / FlGlyR) TaxID=645991 RepID=F0SYU8_SYNGF|nr:hypothetical protein [Syntrophobotulus glycolicus]ADY55985.1 hypothetical protein Sgly_1688 [Syntrophobotulus glycolicus DSM 8271]